MKTNGTPRLAPLPLADWERDAIEQMRGQFPRADRYLSDAPGTPALPGILGLFGHHPGVSLPWLAFNATLLEQASIDTRDRELLILRVAWLTQCAYEWTEHQRIGAQAGLTAEQIAAVRMGADEPIWSPRERALLRAVDEMIDRHRVGDDTWQCLAEDFDRHQLLEILFIVGAYTCLAFVVNSADLAPDRQPIPDMEV